MHRPFQVFAFETMDEYRVGDMSFLRPRRSQGTVPCKLPVLDGLFGLITPCSIEIQKKRALVRTEAWSNAVNDANASINARHGHVLDDPFDIVIRQPHGGRRASNL